MRQSGYACKECGSPARVFEGGEILRSCGHKGTVLAGMSGTAYGVGSMANGNAFERALHAVLKALGKRK